MSPIERKRDRVKKRRRDDKRSREKEETRDNLVDTLKKRDGPTNTKDARASKTSTLESIHANSTDGTSKSSQPKNNLTAEEQKIERQRLKNQQRKALRKEKKLVKAQQAKDTREQDTVQ